MSARTLLYTPHAEQRLVERKIKRDYVDYTIRKGKRDNAPQTYDGVNAFKTRLSGLVVVHTLDSYTAPTILTSYWAKNANLQMFERLLRPQAREKKTHRTPQTASQRRANWRNKSWEFWFDECLYE